MLTVYAILLLCTGPLRASEAAPSRDGPQVVELTVDCGTLVEPRLRKDLLGVYQSPLRSTDTLLRAMPLLAELGVRHFRYELGWGKPDALAHDQISGPSADPTLASESLDQLLGALAQRGVEALLALGYCPNPLKTREGWHAWKDLPGNLDVWSAVVRRYVEHIRARYPGVAYEVWNEPDLAFGDDRVFFTGGLEGYGRLYNATARAVKVAAPEAQVGGAAVAWDQAYTHAMLQTGAPVDFVSVHGYANASGQIAATRAALGARRLPIYLTEYASYTDFGLGKPISRYPAAARFFADMKQLLAEPGLSRVYWAQWVDDPLGIVTESLHRKALFNAMRLYQTMLPETRCAVTPDGAGGVEVLAGADAEGVGVAVWNDGAAPRMVTVRVQNLLLHPGALQVFRIDAEHSSYLDRADAEALAPCERHSIDAEVVTWAGELPGQGMAFLRLN